jgi:hypothetical protein
MTFTQELIDKYASCYPNAPFENTTISIKVDKLKELINEVMSQAAISQHKAVQDESTKLDIAMDVLEAHGLVEVFERNLAAAPSDNKALLESEPVAYRYRYVKGTEWRLSVKSTLEIDHEWLKKEYPDFTIEPLYAHHTPADTVKQDSPNTPSDVG